MSKSWIRETLKAMEKFGSKDVRDTAKLIKANQKKLAYKANVLKPDDTNRWYSLTPTEDGVIINSPPKPKP